jgi:HEPN domain-containing protein
VKCFMKDETGTWLSYADENLEVAELTFDHGHLNACLQNAQQALEKYLKGLKVFPLIEMLFRLFLGRMGSAIPVIMV